MKLLMHTCCAPCSVYCIDELRNENIEPTVYWFNPNIQPYMEYKSRRDCLKEYTKSINIMQYLKKIMVKGFLQKCSRWIRYKMSRLLLSCKIRANCKIC